MYRLGAGEIKKKKAKKKKERIFDYDGGSSLVVSRMFAQSFDIMVSQAIYSLCLGAGFIPRQINQSINLVLQFYNKSTR